MQGDYSENSDAHAVLTELHTQADLNRYSIPDEWLIYKFHQLYIEAYVQNFTLNNPLKENVVYAKVFIHSNHFNGAFIRLNHFRNLPVKMFMEYYVLLAVPA